MSEIGIFYVLFAITLFTLTILLKNRRKRQKRDSLPYYGGWLPWFGCALEFGKQPLFFIGEMRLKLGPIFTLKVAGRRLTFISGLEDITKHFFQSTNVDFQKAAQGPVRKAADISMSSFYECHRTIHDTLKAKLAPGCLEDMCIDLSRKIARQLTALGSTGDGDLMNLVRSVLYRASLEQFYGDGTLPIDSKESYLEFEKHFVNFDLNFEKGTHLPEILIRDWSNSKHWLLDFFRKVVSKTSPGNSEGKETIFENLKTVVGKEFSPNYSLLLTFASLSNAVPMTFWVLAFITGNAKVVDKVRHEVVRAFGRRGQDLSSLSCTYELLQSMPFLRRCVLETIRLRSPGVIARLVMTSFSCRGYTIPAGDMLMVSPYWEHRNPALFPEPDAFKPDRWLNANLEKNLYLEGFVGFGGGRYQCPGRWFALLEIQLFVAQFLYRFDVTLLEPLPQPSPERVVGSPLPIQTLLVKFNAV